MCCWTRRGHRSTNSGRHGACALGAGRGRLVSQSRLRPADSRHRDLLGRDASPVRSLTWAWSSWLCPNAASPARAKGWLPWHLFSARPKSSGPYMPKTHLYGIVPRGHRGLRAVWGPAGTSGGTVDSLPWRPTSAALELGMPGAAQADLGISSKMPGLARIIDEGKTAR